MRASKQACRCEKGIQQKGNKQRDLAASKTPKQATEHTMTQCDTDVPASSYDIMYPLGPEHLTERLWFLPVHCARQSHRAARQETAEQLLIEAKHDFNI